MNLAEELTQYLNESQARGNKVMSIDGLRAIIQRHSPCDCVGGAHSSQNGLEDETLRRNMERAYRANMGMKRRGG